MVNTNFNFKNYLMHLKGVQILSTLVDQMIAEGVNTYFTPKEDGDYVTYHGTSYKIVSMAGGDNKNVSYSIMNFVNGRITPICAVFDNTVYFLDVNSITSIIRNTHNYFIPDNGKAEYYVFKISAVNKYAVKIFSNNYTNTDTKKLHAKATSTKVTTKVTLLTCTTSY